MTRNAQAVEGHVPQGPARGRRHGAFSPTASIARAIVIKDGDLFFLSARDGEVPAGAHGLGLYYHDCRYLNRYELRLAGCRATPLAATGTEGFRSIIELTNPELRIGGDRIPEENIGLKCERTVDGTKLALRERIVIQNFGLDHIDLPVSLTWDAGFEDVFSVRGMVAERRGTLERPTWTRGVLAFAYAGADGVRRTLDVHVTPAPARTDGTTAEVHVSVEAGQTAEIVTTLALHESASDDIDEPRGDRAASAADVGHGLDDACARWLAGHPELRTPSVLLQTLVQRSLRDLHALRTEQRGHAFFAAGVPWYVALFGRDAIIAALETLAWDPSIAEQTLRLLATYQGRRVDAWREEQPGKILHELRVGEMARVGEIPQTPYYGSIDATPLFLILLARHAAWTGTLRVFHDLRTHVDAALDWMDQAIDRRAGGYIAYTGSTVKGLANQGWKDSGDSVVNRDGTLARPPIALAEVQGYAYFAQRAIADLYERAGDETRASALRYAADELRGRFNREFWVDAIGTYALALQQDGAPAAVVASNAGQVLWTGIADPAKAAGVVARLMRDDMFSGWGVRTLSSRERRYNPIGYHVGTVWPHDNALIAAGFRRYGFDTEALRVLDGILAAAMHFEHQRLPEVFAGFTRQEYEAPVHYPVACHPQAWAAGAVPYLLETCLGLVPDAFERRLSVVRPVLPDYVSTLEIHRLRIGDASADLRFERGPDGMLAAKTLRVDGPLEVVTETAA